MIIVGIQIVNEPTIATNDSYQGNMDRCGEQPHRLLTAARTQFPYPVNLGYVSVDRGTKRYHTTGDLDVDYNDN